MGQRLLVFSVGNRGLMIFQRQNRFFDEKQKTVFAEKWLLRESFKVAVKEIGKENKLKTFFSSILIF